VYLLVEQYVVKNSHLVTFFALTSRIACYTWDVLSATPAPGSHFQVLRNSLAPSPITATFVETGSCWLDDMALLNKIADAIGSDSLAGTTRHKICTYAFDDARFSSLSNAPFWLTKKM
jgi:hypothetical protein